VDQRLENAIDAGLGDMGFLEDVFQCERGVGLLQEFEDIEGLGENRDQIEALDLCLSQL
jgi:hypothetical protein